jgi:hypothetical protein
VQIPTVCHAGVEKRFIDGTQLIYNSKSKLEDCSIDMNATFYNQMEETLIPNMPLGDVILIDKAEYDTIQENKSSTISCRKADTM